MVTVTKELQATLQSAVADARRRRHEYVTLEHLLHAMTRDKVASEILAACGADLAELEKELEDYLDRTLEARTGSGRTGADRGLPARAAAGRLARPGRGAHRAERRRRAGGHHPRARLPRRLPPRASRACAASTSCPTSPTASPRTRRAPCRGGGVPGRAAGRGRATRREGPVPRLHAPTWSRRPPRGEIDPLIGREPELERTIQVLCRRRKNNPVFVGEPGVGKTAIVEGLALAIHEKQVPAGAGEGDDLLARHGRAARRHQVPRRVRGAAQGGHRRGEEDPARHPLHRRDPHHRRRRRHHRRLAWTPPTCSSPALASGELRCIGSTTFQEYKQTFERDRALARRFQKIEVHEPTRRGDRARSSRA